MSGQMRIKPPKKRLKEKKRKTIANTIPRKSAADELRKTRQKTERET